MTKYVLHCLRLHCRRFHPRVLPVCKAPASKFIEKKENTYVTEHVVGIAKDAPEGDPAGPA